MKSTEPIRSKKLIRDILIHLRSKNDRNYIFFLIGLHTGLRVSDLLRLRVRDVKDKTHINLIEGKTGKSKQIIISDELRKELKTYCEGKQHYEFLFKSREGGNDPISRVRAYQILIEIGDIFGIHISCHVLRKTFGLDHYERNKDVAALMKIFNHSSPEITLTYIGVIQKELDLSMKSTSFL